MVNTNTEPKYSIDEIRQAFENAKNGNLNDYGEPLNAFAVQAIKGDHIYRIGPDDLDAFLDGHPNLDDEQRARFHSHARQFIDNNEIFGETLAICLDMAMEEVRSA